MNDQAFRRARRCIPRIAIAIVATIVSACATADFSSWKPYSPDGSAFSVSMPGTPIREHKSAMNPRGDLETDIYSLDLADGGFLTITDTMLPPDLNVESGATELLDSSVSRIVQSASGKLHYTRDVVVAGYTAREFEADVPTAAVAGGGRLRARVLLAGTRLYEVIGVVPNRRTADSELSHFLDSFTLREPRRTN